MCSQEAGTTESIHADAGQNFYLRPRWYYGAFCFIRASFVSGCSLELVAGKRKGLRRKKLDQSKYKFRHHFTFTRKPESTHWNQLVYLVMSSQTLQICPLWHANEEHQQRRPNSMLKPRGDRGRDCDYLITRLPIWRRQDFSFPPTLRLGQGWGIVFWNKLSLLRMVFAMPQAAAGQAVMKTGFLPAELLIPYQQCTRDRRRKSTDTCLWMGGSKHMKCFL